MPSPEVPEAAPEVQARWAALFARAAELDDLTAAGHLLGWDQQTMMPPGGGEPRGEVLATLTRLAHERTTDDGLLELLDELAPWAERELPADDVRADLLRVLRHDVERARRVPSDLTAAISLDRVRDAAGLAARTGRERLGRLRAATSSATSPCAASSPPATRPSTPTTRCWRPTSRA